MEAVILQGILNTYDTYSLMDSVSDKILNFGVDLGLVENLSRI